MDRGIENAALRVSYLALAVARGATLKLGIGVHTGKWITLYYHAVTAGQRRRFRRQLKALGQCVVPTDAIGRPVGGSAGPGLCLTFDDGFVSVLENAVPYLAEHRAHATIFAVSGNLGRKPEWRMAAGNPDVAETVMTSAQLRSLPPDLISVGSHTVTHRRLSELSPEEVRAEVADSKSALEDILGRPVRALAFPHGAYSDEAVGSAYEAGYEQLFTIEACMHPGPLPMGLIGRFAASAGERDLELRLKAMGAYDWLYAVRQAKRRLMAAPQSPRPGKTVDAVGVKVEI